MRLTLAQPLSMPHTHSSLRLVQWVRYALPLFLFVLASGFEFWEHWVKTKTLFLDPGGLLEVFIFGVLGPTAVFITLTYVNRLLNALETARWQTAVLNQNLEKIVEERTHALEKSNAQLVHANARLQELDQMKSDFVSLVSHELRAPLATLNGGLEVALQYPAQLPVKAQRVLQLLLTETVRLTEFVQMMLDVGQLEAGKLRVHCGPVALKPLLRQAAAVTLGADAGRVVWQLPPDVPPIWADETYTEEIVRNLLRNAQKYTPPGSPIELKVTVEPNELCLCVTDYGPGIPAERQAQVFERFGRVPPSHEQGDQPRGWGLGLYFARMLLAQQGGSLMLHSPVHTAADAPGSRFVLRLPLAEEAPHGEAASD